MEWLSSALRSSEENRWLDPLRCGHALTYKSRYLPMTSIDLSSRMASQPTAQAALGIAMSTLNAQDGPDPKRVASCPSDDQGSISSSSSSLTLSIPPMDRGWRAWVFVASAFVLQCLIWGFYDRYSLPLYLFCEHALIPLYSYDIIRGTFQIYPMDSFSSFNPYC